MSDGSTDRDNFTVAIICALAFEANAVEALFDVHYDPRIYGQLSADDNTYSLGHMAGHEVVLVWMPGIGKRDAATAASNLKFSFRKVRLAMVVGTCGGVPFPGNGREEIMLGDVVISDAVIEYDFGRRFPDKFRRKDSAQDRLRPQPRWIKNVLRRLQVGPPHMLRLAQTTNENVEFLKSTLGDRAPYPKRDDDRLLKATHRHKHHASSCPICTKCKEKLDPVCDNALYASCRDLKCWAREEDIVPRQWSVQHNPGSENAAYEPTIHIGTIASGDTIMRCGEDRDEIASQTTAIAFEMEGAGVWDILPCVLIKGVSNYADSHKNDDFRHVGAATAAACTKAFLTECMPVYRAAENLAISRNNHRQMAAVYLCTIERRNASYNAEVASDGEAGDRETSGGEVSGGEVSDGEVSDGEVSDGELSDGELSDGELSDGELSDGELSDGDASNEEAGWRCCDVEAGWGRW